MTVFASVEDRDAIEAEMPWTDCAPATTLYEFISNTAAKHGDSDATSFQMFSAPDAAAETLTWEGLRAQVAQAANLFRSLGVGEKDVVAFLLPNSSETPVVMLGGAVAGIVCPINPLLDPAQIASILREVGAKVVVTLKSFPKSDIGQKVGLALEDAPDVHTLLEIDLLRYMPWPKSWIVPFIRPKNPVGHKARVLSFRQELKKQNTTLDFADSTGDRVAAYFHTGGTTGMPKVVQHRYSGMIYNGWIGHRLLFRVEDNVICPLPMFHVFAAHVILMSMIASGAHVVFPTPAGYRGEGVFDKFWKLIERWNITFVITVPTALSALMQRPVDADISCVRTAFSGSSPLPIKLFNRFEDASKVNIIEGYGLTEATCLVACNPIDGPKKIGSVGIPFPHTDVKILKCAPDGTVLETCGVDEPGEICVSSPGVYLGETYTEAHLNVGLYADQKYLRTGDLGRIDAEGYLWITGRAKDLIIRGGHNIDPADIEEALAGHKAVAMVGAIGQPDSFTGELPCAYVELVDGASATVEELQEFANTHVLERAARPKFLEILPEMPKTAVGKVLKPELRKMAIKRVYDTALKTAGIAATVADVVEDKHLGLVAIVSQTGDVPAGAIEAVLDDYTIPWRKKAE